jgi:hypothetical protein
MAMSQFFLFFAGVMGDGRVAHARIHSRPPKYDEDEVSFSGPPIQSQFTPRTDAGEINRLLEDFHALQDMIVKPHVG